METTIHSIGTNSRTPVIGKQANVQEISVAWDKAANGVTVTPGSVNKGATVRFKDPAGSKLKIVFLSPSGKEGETVLDTDVCTLTIGGGYHFKCYFTPRGAKRAISPSNGGFLDVLPHRP